MAQESEVLDFSDARFPKEIEVIPLPGHFFNMVGFRTPDETVFLADCMSSRDTLEKYGVAFIYDVEAYMETLDRVERMKASMFVPSHAEAATDITELVRYNREKANEVAERILSICEEPVNFEQILQEVFQEYGLVMNFEQYALVGSTVRSYLSWLKDHGKLAVEFKDSQMLPASSGTPAAALSRTPSQIQMEVLSEIPFEVLSEIPFEVLFLFESPQAPLYCSCLFPYPAHLLRTPWFFPIPPSPARSRFP